LNNLQNYFTRIGYAEDPSISLATLEKLQQLHTSVIPFENIDVLLGLDVDLKPEAIEKKLLVQGRGGYSSPPSIRNERCANDQSRSIPNY